MAALEVLPVVVVMAVTAADQARMRTAVDAITNRQAGCRPLGMVVVTETRQAAESASALATTSATPCVASFGWAGAGVEAGFNAGLALAAAVYGDTPEAYVMTTAAATSGPGRLRASLGGLRENPMADVWVPLAASAAGGAPFSAAGQEALRGTSVRRVLGDGGDFYPDVGAGGAASLAVILPTALGGEPVLTLPPGVATVSTYPNLPPSGRAAPRKRRSAFVAVLAVGIACFLGVALVLGGLEVADWHRRRLSQPGRRVEAAGVADAGGGELP